MLKNLTLMTFVKIALKYVFARFYLFLNGICLKIKVNIFGKILFVFKLDMFKKQGRFYFILKEIQYVCIFKAYIFL
jgi:hypothetical protein